MVVALFCGLQVKIKEEGKTYQLQVSPREHEEILYGGYLGLANQALNECPQFPFLLNVFYKKSVKVQKCLMTFFTMVLCLCYLNLIIHIT